MREPVTEVGGSAGAAATDVGYDGDCHYDDQEGNAELCREWNGGLRLLTAIGLVKRRLLRLGEGVFLFLGCYGLPLFLLGKV